MKKYVTINAMKKIDEKNRKIIWNKSNTKFCYVEQYIEYTDKRNISKLAKVIVYENHMIMDI